MVLYADAMNDNELKRSQGTECLNYFYIENRDKDRKIRLRPKSRKYSWRESRAISQVSGHGHSAERIDTS